jgi:Fe-S cluster biogenesis protein NfuA
MPDSTLQARVATVLREHAAPALELDADELTVVDVADGIVSIRFGPACQSCSGGLMGLVAALEAELKPHLPEIDFVEAVP